MSNGKAYNLKITPLPGTVVHGTNANGKPKITMKGTFMRSGKELTRTVIAQGEAATAIQNVISEGTASALRILFARAPGDVDGVQVEGKGGEYCVVVGLPAKKAA